MKVGRREGELIHSAIAASRMMEMERRRLFGLAAPISFCKQSRSSSLASP